MKRVTGIGGIFFKSDKPLNCLPGTKNIWAFHACPTVLPVPRLAPSIGATMTSPSRKG
jgi:hypothetical protein